MAVTTHTRGSRRGRAQGPRRGRGSAPKSTRQRGPGRWWQDPKVMPFLLVAPALLFELLVHLVPMVAGIAMAFFRLTVFTIHHWTTAPFAGLENFRITLDVTGPVGQGLLQSFLVTVPYTVLVLGFSWIIAMAAAVFLSFEFKGRNVLRGVFLIPYALPGFVSVIAWTFMFQRDNGAINHILVNDLHLAHSGPFWLLGGNAFWAMTITVVWKTWPFAFIMLLAAIQTIPDEQYEAATLDGASGWRQFWNVLLPQVRQTNYIVLLVLGIGTFNDFSTPFVMFGQSPPKSAELVNIYIYNNAFGQWNFGLGSAMSVLLLIFLAVASFIFLRATRTGANTDA